MRVKDEFGITGFGLVLVGIGLMLVFIGGVMSLVYASERYACAIDGNELRMETHYRMFGSGCYVELEDGRSIPLDRYRAMEQVK